MSGRSAGIPTGPRYPGLHPVAATISGSLAQRQGPSQLPNVQGLIMYRYAMEALKKMGYLDVGLGEYESALSLFDLQLDTGAAPR